MIENESDLVQRARTGDTDAYNQLCKAYEKELHDHIFIRITNGNYHNAQDCLQEVFLRGWLTLKNYKGKDIMPWFRGIAGKIELETIREKTKRKESSLEQIFTDKETGELLEPASTDPLPDEVYCQKHAWKENTVLLAIGTMPASFAHKRILMFMIEGLSISEIIQQKLLVAYGYDTPDKIKKLRIKARESLQRELKKRGFSDKMIGLEWKAKEVEYEREE